MKAVSKDVYQESNSGTHYFDEIYGTMAKGTVTIQGQSHQFDEATGVLK